ncbi:MAG: hypothetical protein ABMA64_26375 [Myxococcota bacterium]
MKTIEKFGLVAWIVFAGGCPAGGGGEPEACDAKDGQWSMVMTLEADADPFCPEVPSGTFDLGASTSDDCDPGCTCGVAEDADTCSATYDETCADDTSESVVACDLVLDSRTAMSGACSVSVHVLDPDTTVECAYAVEATWQE